MKMNQKGNDNFCTPNFIFRQLNNQFNFTLDAACTRENCLVPFQFENELQWNGLTQSWLCHRVFCNPPFSEKDKWIEKAHDEVFNGECPVCVMILPSNCMDIKAFHDYVIRPGYHFEVLEGRISFEINGVPKKGNNSGTVLVFFRKTIKTKELK